MKRPYYISLGVVVLLVVIVLRLPSKTTSQIKLAISSLFLPFFGLASSVEHASERAGNELLPRRTLLRQRDQLRQENQQLRFQLLAFKSNLPGSLKQPESSAGIRLTGGGRSRLTSAARMEPKLICL